MKTPVVLLIEDQTELREMLSFSLADQGYEVVEADNITEGFRLFLSRSPDLVISDLTLHAVCALQTVCQMKVQNPFCRIFTISADWAKLRTSMRLGIDAHFLKPFGIADLLGAVRQCMAGGAR